MELAGRKGHGRLRQSDRIVPARCRHVRRTFQRPQWLPGPVLSFLPGRHRFQCNAPQRAPDATPHCLRARADKKIDVLRYSFAGPHSKIWVLGDSAPFRTAREGEFRPRRWADRSPAPSPWLRAPRPDMPGIEVKGTWVSSSDQQYQEDPLKADRHCSMSERGFA